LFDWFVKGYGMSGRNQSGFGLFGAKIRHLFSAFWPSLIALQKP
jgi:hypothetical protein